MARSAEEIRADLLGTLQTEFQTLNLRIVTAENSPVYALATAIALEVEGPEAEAEAARREAFPATASEEGVLRHAEFDGLVRIPAARAVLRMRVEGTPSSLLTIPEGATLTSPDGLVFLATPGVVTTQVSGFAYTTVTARDPGAVGNLPLGTTLRWQPAPSGFAATAVVALDAIAGDVTPFLVVGSAEETVEELRRRVVRYRREPPKAGCRGDWVEWSEEVEGVGASFVYPRVWRSGASWQTDLPGVLVLIPLGEAPDPNTYQQRADGTMLLGLSPSFTRSPSSTLRERVKDYIEGLAFRDGSPMPPALREELRPVGVAKDNYSVEAPGLRAVPITVTVETDPGVAPWPWTTPAFRTVSSSTTTTLTLDSAAGIRPGTKVAVQLGTSVVRGGWWIVTVASVASNVLTLSTPLPVAASAGAQVRPDCGLWSEVRRLVLAAFDALGPGDLPTPVACQRFPRPQYESPDRMTASGVIVAVSELVGVVSVVVEFPDESGSPSQVTATPGELLVPGEIVVLPPL